MNDTTHKTLEVEVLNIHKGEYLSEALKRQGYPMLPSNAIINKVMTGTGATYMELNPKLSPRNSIVIEPYRSAVGKSSVRCPLKPSDSIPLCPNNPAH